MKPRDHAPARGAAALGAGIFERSAKRGFAGAVPFTVSRAAADLKKRPNAGPASILALAGLLCALITLGGCETRARDNPFDPRNPETGGTPPLLTAVAKNHRVDLRWDDGGMTDVAGYSVYRGTSVESLIPIASVIPDRRDMPDVGLANDVTYYYAIGFAFFGQGELRTAVERATPGPNMPWVLDGSQSPLALLAADGRHVVSRHSGGGNPVDISVDQDTGNVWVVDPYAGTLTAYESRDFSGRLAARLGGYISPTRVSADRVYGGLWVISFDEGLLYRVDGSYVKTVINSSLNGPLDVAASPKGGCWVAESTGSISRVKADGGTFAVDVLDYPVELSATDSADVWVADSAADQVIRVSEGGVQARAGGFLGPFGVSAAPDGGCWVADGDRVVKIDRSGEITVIVTGFEGAASLDVSPRTGECWVVDNKANSVVRLDPDGVRITATTEVSSPFRLQGQWRDIK